MRQLYGVAVPPPMSAAEGEAYLSKHGLQEVLSAAVHRVMDSRAEKPLTAIAQMLLAAERAQ